MDMDVSFCIDHASCADEAFKKLATGCYDVVVSDYEMPPKDGLQFLKELREQKNEIPFILFTGKGREEVAIKALNLGADGYINKLGDPETIYGELSHDIRRIAEHIKTKKELRDRDIRLAKIASQTPGMLYQFMRRPDSTYCVPFTSEAIRNVFGCSPQDAREDFSPIAKAIIPEDRSKVIASIELSAVNMTPWQCEYRVQLPGQQIRWVWGQSIPEKLEDGSIIWSGYNADITERKIAEQALTRSEAKYRSLFANMLDGFAYCKMLFDKEGKPLDFIYLEVNGAFEKLTGLKKETVVGRQATEAIPGIKKDNPELFEIYGRVAATGKDEKFEVFFKPLNMWLSVGVYSPEKGYFVAIFENITERKKTEEALRKERDKLESVTATIGAGLVVVSKDFQVLWANNFIKRYKGDTIGKMCYATLNSLSAPCPDCGVGKVFAGKTTLDSHEYCSTTIDGKPYWVEIVATPITDEKGNITSAVEIAVDITEKKEAEKKLKEDSDRIELMNEKLRVVGGLTRHDVRNKLVTVTGNVYLLKKKHPDQADIVEGLDKMEQAVNEVVRIFDFARMYEQLGVEKLIYVDVEKTVNEAIGLFSGLTFMVVNDCHGLILLADSFLRQLFYNFVDNTRKYGEKTTAARVHFEETASGEVRLIYEDDGGGISTENKLKLFTEGFSTEGSTGFGLFLIKKMMDVYGWTIQETGEPGKGAKFVITIPRVNQSGKENYQIEP
jgi:PAS domain S-box-containing protein